MSGEGLIVETTRQRLSAIWIVPLVALVLGIWLAVNAYLQQGPTITLRFTSADAIQAEKTLVKIRNVTIGTVTNVRLADDLDGVILTAALAPEARQLLRADTEFWVVKAEVSASSITGLGTLLSGAYIELSPGVGPVTKEREFEGLDRMPISPPGTPGMQLRLVSRSSGSVSVGSPILYRGYRVGTVEQIQLDVDTQRVLYDIFIDAPYDQLVSSSTRFWNASGISAELSTEGVKLSIGSLQSALAGGVSFDQPNSAAPGREVDADRVFKLYPNESSIHEHPYRNSVEYVVSFKQSLRGLHPGAPVTYRGIRVGSVVRIMLSDLNASGDINDTGMAIPVLIMLEPGRLTLGDDAQGVELTRQSIQIAVERGLRGSLESGNLLTGSQFVELDFYDTDQQEVGEFIGYPTIPSIDGGFTHIQAQISQLLEKLNGLPIEGALTAAKDALEELEGTLGAARSLIASEKMQQLPDTLQVALGKVNDVLDGFSSDSEFQTELVRVLEELKGTLQSVDSLADQLDAKPNSLVFPSKQIVDPEPRAEP